MTDPTKWWEAAPVAPPGGLAPSRGFIYKPPPSPTDPYKGPTAQADLTRKQQEIAAAAATAPDTVREAKARADKAALDLKVEQEAYNSQHPKGTNATVLGPDALKSMPGPDQEIVKALGTGRLAFPGGSAMRSPWWQQKLEQVAQVFPDFDATNYNQRAKARAILLNGKVGTASNALNTAIGHTGHLNEQISGTASHSFVPFNHVQNLITEMFGGAGPTNFKDTAGKLASELTSAYRNGGGAEADVIRGLQSLDPNMSEEQKRGVVRNTIELLASKQAANLYQYGLGMGGKADVDLLDPDARAVLNQFPDIRDKHFAPPAQLGNDAAAALRANGGTPPPPPAPDPGTGDTPPPTLGGGNGPAAPSVPHADYSALTGGREETVATGPTRNVYDPLTSAKLNAMIHRGRPYEEAAAIVPPEDGPIDPHQYVQAVAFAKTHPHWQAAEATRGVQTTVGQQIASSPAAAALVGAQAGATAGLTDTAGRMIAGEKWDANRHALADLHPTADLIGNAAGGIVGTIAAPAALARVAPGAMALGAQAAAKLGRFAPAVGDAAYSALYGANENPDAPLTGALEGGLTGVVAGAAGRKLTRGLANVIAPPAGEFGPLYEQGIFPTPGQRFAKSGLAGRMVSGTEQAMQSVPVLGAAPAAARQATRDAFQVGAFDRSLKELEPFVTAGVSVPTELPAGTGPGTQAHALTASAFDKAYGHARSGMQFAPDAQYLSDAQALSQKVGSGVLRPDQAKQIGAVVDNAVVARLKAQGGVLNGDAYKAASSDLGRAIQTWGRNPDTAPMAEALGDYASIFDNAARRASHPDAVNLLDAADRGYAQFVRIQRASEMGGAAKDAGTFTPTNYAGSVKQNGGGLRSNAYNRGEALGQDYAQAGLNLKDTLADSGTAVRLGTLGALQGAEGVGLATTHSLGMLLNPKTIGAFAPYLPVVREATNRLIAPRQYTLPPVFSAPLIRLGNQVNDAAPMIGKAAIPGALAYYGSGQ